MLSRHGELSLRFTHAEGRNVLAESFFRTPLQVMRPIYDAAGCLYIYLLSPTGGVVQGDSYHIQLKAEAGSHSIFTTQAATKAYRMPDCPATQSIEIDLAEDAILEFIPDALILFKDADFLQRIRVNLGPRSLFIFQDIIMGGRIASGEVFQFRRYQSHLKASDARGLLLYDPCGIEPSQENPLQLGIMDGYTCWGTWYLLGDLAHYGIQAEQFCADHASPVLHDGLFGISTLHRNGVNARIISHSLSTIYQQFEALRQSVRQNYLKLPASLLRK